MQLEFHSLPPRPTPVLIPGRDSLLLAGRAVPLHWVRNPRARRYVLRLTREGVARVTVPRRGSLAEARRFVEKNVAWLEEQVLHQLHNAQQRRWQVGSTILLRGDKVLIEPLGGGLPGVRLGQQIFTRDEPDGNFQTWLEDQLWTLATKELPPRVFELAATRELPVRRVAVRNQCSRWGSCSRTGTISLNWHLIQVPGWVRDYLIWHELMHLREMNHSPRYWALVAEVCPEHRQAERWLDQHRHLVR